MEAEADIAVVTMRNTTFYEVHELGTVAKVSKGPSAG